MAFTADLGLAGLHPLLYTIELNRTSAVLALESAQGTGTITFDKGRIVDARCGAAEGAEALSVILEWTDGTLRLEAFAAPATRTVEGPNSAVLVVVPTLAREPNPEAKIEGDGQEFSLVHLLELFHFSGAKVRVAVEGGELVLARGTLADARFGEHTGSEALFRVLERGSVPFRAKAEPAAVERTEAPLHAELVGALGKVSDARFLLRRGADDEIAVLRSLVEDLNAGHISREVRIALARRLMPGPSVTPPETLSRLCLDEDETVRSAAKETVETLDLEVLLVLMASPATPMPLLRHLIEVYRSDAEVLAAAAGNPALEEELAVRLAQMADVTVAEALLHSKWGNAVSVREALGRDSGTTGRMARSHEAAEAAKAPVAANAPAGGGKIAKRRPLNTLSLKEQLFLAAGGNQRQQLTLVCSPTPAVACAVITSPRMNDNTAMSIAQLTTANSDALRELVGQKRYSNQYPIARMLAFNPKCPAGAALEVLSRLKDHDLKSLSKSTGVADTVRSAAARMLAQREERRKMK